jgi:hypothetical protein
MGITRSDPTPTIHPHKLDGIWVFGDPPLFEYFDEAPPRLHARFPPAVEETAAAMVIYALRGTCDRLITELRDQDPAERTSSAQAIGIVHVYLALPFVLDTARNDTAPEVREAARQAVIDLMPSEDAADRAIAESAPFPEAKQHGSQKQQAASVIALFKEYVAARSSGSGRGAGPDLTGSAIGYLVVWGGRSALDMDALELTAAMTVGAITRHVEIPPQNAGPKHLSYIDARNLVDEYEAALQA